MVSVVVLAGPSGSGKSRLAGRLGLPVLRLDDFYRSADDPSLPHLPGGLVDWDDPRSWLLEEAVEALRQLCHDGVTEVPHYDLATSSRVGSSRLAAGGAPYVVAEGIFAQEVVTGCRDAGLLEVAICLTQPAALTFWRRLVRDLREHRKPPLVLLRRGLRLAREQRHVVQHAVALGCRPMSGREATALLAARMNAARR